jgi:hypothetical protein
MTTIPSYVLVPRLFLWVLFKLFTSLGSWYCKLLVVASSLCSPVQRCEKKRASLYSLAPWMPRAYLYCSTFGLLLACAGGRFRSTALQGAMVPRKANLTVRPAAPGIKLHDVNRNLNNRNRSRLYKVLRKPQALIWLLEYKQLFAITSSVPLFCYCNCC